MNNSKFVKTNTENLISNLRGELGEIIVSWILMRDFIMISNKIRPADLKEQMQNKDINRIKIIIEKFKNDTISRLSELGQDKVGQINFYFASKKLSILKEEVVEYEYFIKRNKFRDRRNQYISHKQLPPTWEGHRAPQRISYLTILRGIAKA